MACVGHPPKRGLAFSEFDEALPPTLHRLGFVHAQEPLCVNGLHSPARRAPAGDGMQLSDTRGLLNKALVSGGRPRVV